MMDETRARFLAAIASQIPVERVAEVHLFPAIRQGGMESGVAVLALDLAAAPVPASESALVSGASAGHASDATLDTASDEHAASAIVGDADEEDGPYAAEEAGDGDELREFDDLDGRAEPDEAQDARDPEDIVAPAPRPTPRRFTVYTARYRHTLKGPDRGKWEVSVTEEADAPLLTVDAVVRGVQRRSGDVDEIVRLTGEEMRGGL